MLDLSSYFFSNSCIYALIYIYICMNAILVFFFFLGGPWRRKYFLNGIGTFLSVFLFFG